MNRSTWTTVLALLLVPLVTAGAFLWGTSAVDRDLRRVQAAIVNNDEMVTVNGQAMPLGRQLAAELVDSDRRQNYTWVIATPEKAAEGLRTGRYAAVVTIPKEFSAAATSFSKPPSEAVRATLRVETSPVAGLDEAALGQNITAASVRALNQFLTGEYLKNIYLGFNEMHQQMQQLADGTGKLADGARQLADGTRQSADGADALADGLGQASAGSAQLRGGARQAADGAGRLEAGADQLAGGAGQLAQGADAFAGGVATYAGGVDRYVAGVDQYAGGVNSLVGPLRDTIERLPEWGTFLSDSQVSVGSLTAQASAFDAQVQDAVGQLRGFVEGAAALSGPTASVAADVREIADTAGVLAAGKRPCPADLAEIEGACAAYQRGVADAGQQIVGLAQPAAAKAEGVATQAGMLAAAKPRIIALLDQVSGTSKQVAGWAPGVQAELERLQQAMPAGGPTSRAETLALLDRFIAAGGELSAGGRALSEGGAQLGAGARQLADGARALGGGATQYADGVGALGTGLIKLSDGVDAYTGGVDAAASGARQLADGMGQLSAGADQLTGGTRDLADGVAGGVDKVPTYSDAERDQLASAASAPIDAAAFDGLVRPSLSWVTLLLVSALWVGALATSSAVPALGRRAALSTAGNAELLVSSLGPVVALVSGQALLLAMVGIAVLQLGVGESVLFTFVMLVSGVAFAVVNHALARLFGNLGRLVSLGLLVLTVVGAATSTAPQAIEALRALSPASPALAAARQVVTTGNVTIPVLVLIGWALLGLVGVVTSLVRARTVPLEQVARG